MERVAFLIEETNERLRCLLNPEKLVMRRWAGVKSRRSVSGQFTGIGLADAPLFYTGGGRTELDLELLFDLSLAGSSITSDDVRDLTRPLWNLAENGTAFDRYGQDRVAGRPPLVRFVWGKSWNIPAIVVAVAERLEHFTPAGAPQRSWLRMRLVRVTPPSMTEQKPSFSPSFSTSNFSLAGMEVLENQVQAHQRLGSNAGTGALEGEQTGATQMGERLDELAFQYYQDPSFWRLLALYNDIDDPLRIETSTLRIPPLSAFGW